MLKNALVPTILLGLALAVPNPVTSAEQQDLPADCQNADFTVTGRPVMFAPSKGLAMGISAARETFVAGEPIPIYVWVDNQTDREQGLESCGMWFAWGIDVYQAPDGHRMKTRRERETESNPALQRQVELQTCFRNLLLRVPSHTCAPLHDMGNVLLDINKVYDLPAGTYLVTQKPLVLPLRGLSVKIADKPAAAER